MFRQIDLFYRPDLDNHTKFNIDIYRYEYKRLHMRANQLHKLFDELKEDKEQLQRYKQLAETTETLPKSESDKQCLLYLVMKAEEQNAELKLHRTVAQAVYGRRETTVSREDTIEYIPSDIHIDVDTRTIRSCITRRCTSCQQASQDQTSQTTGNSRRHSTHLSILKSKLD